METFNLLGKLSVTNQSQSLTPRQYIKHNKFKALPSIDIQAEADLL